MDVRSSMHKVKQKKTSTWNSKNYGILGTRQDSTKEKSVWAKIKAKALKERESSK